MNVLNYNEKVFLIILVILTLITVYITTYLAINQKCTYEPISSGNIYVINTLDSIDPNFVEDFKKDKHKIGNLNFSQYKPDPSQNKFKPSFWNELAHEIGSEYSKYDAFVIILDKNSLVYTASVLAFIIENLTKPILLTSKQLVQTLKLVSHTKIPEVMINEQGRLLRGCRAMLTAGMELTSPNYPDLNEANALSLPTEQTQIKILNPATMVSIVKLFPGMDPKYLDSLTNMLGIIVETGGMEQNLTAANFLKSINELTKKGVVIIVVSENNSSMDLRLIEAGALSGFDMTTAAAYAKLLFLLGNVKEKKFIGQLIEQSFRGELTNNNLALR